MGASYVSDAAVNSDDFEPEKTGGIDKPHLNPNVVNMPTCDHVAVSTLPSAAVKAASAIATGIFFLLRQLDCISLPFWAHPGRC